MSISGRSSILPTPRSHRLQPGSQKEVDLIHYLDSHILKITSRYAKKFSNEGQVNDDTLGYQTYAEFVADVEPLVDVVWISGTPSIQIPYLLQLAGLACSYLAAFPFSASVFLLMSKIDQGFATILQPSQNNKAETTISYKANMTEKVRIKSLIEETRIAAVNAVSSSGHAANVHVVSETETEEETNDKLDERDGNGGTGQNISVSLALSRVYERTLEILGDSLINDIPP